MVVRYVSGLTGTLTASGHRSVKWIHAFNTSQQNVWFSVLPRRSRSSVVRKRLFAREAASLDPCDHAESERRVVECIRVGR